MRSVLVRSTAVLALAACASVPAPGREAEAEAALPASYRIATDGTATPALWWRAFGEPELADYVERALSQNLDLTASTARVAQARARLRIAGASLLPSVNASVGAQTSYSGAEQQRLVDGFVTTESWRTATSGSVQISYELDLFGANRAGRRSAAASYDAQRYADDALRITTAADTASAYFSVLAGAQSLAIAQSSLEALERISRIVQLRYDEGAVSGQDLARQRAEVAQARSQIPSLEAQLDASRQALALLLAEAVPPAPLENRDLLSFNVPTIATGLPADLLLRRPDLRSAQANLAAADADVAAARAALFPSIDLSASVGTSSLSDPAATASFAGSLVQPIFQGGRLRGQLAERLARLDELDADYRRTVLTAFQEVERALSGLQASAAQEQALITAAEAAAEAFRIAQVRYEDGADDLLNLLDAERSLSSARSGLVTARFDRLTAALDLFRALGGDWSSS
ncbi:efflux transporter outer membrane subunit [Parvularcula dongshanensis]|uniref:NodT family efflux transporter outer membrane factor (OMF) lipoprotein n=1 Tax=Parvularcula dongshanensis TaxID=1173995 RepID=A0A840I656_9PROT|nr:efflux transporter outer membrane subunit [Parvularcula dongshanensis]MBB4660416.1 NodT family efflux transporter outer membrane factor (OMF) lipoprotein [Parvularcula dongshanensis]